MWEVLSKFFVVMKWFERNLYFVFKQMQDVNQEIENTQDVVRLRKCTMTCPRINEGSFLVVHLYYNAERGPDLG